MNRVVGVRGYSSQSLLSISANLEYINNYFTDLVFIEIRPGKNTPDHQYKYDKENGLSMKTNAIKLRSLAIAMKELAYSTDKQSSYEQFTGTNNSKKKLTLGYKEGKNTDNKMVENYFININNTSVFFPRWEFLSFAESLLILADETEKALYKYQRHMNKLKEEGVS